MSSLSWVLDGSRSSALSRFSVYTPTSSILGNVEEHRCCHLEQWCTFTAFCLRL